MHSDVDRFVFCVGARLGSLGRRGGARVQVGTGAPRRAVGGPVEPEGSQGSQGGGGPRQTHAEGHAEGAERGGVQSATKNIKLLSLFNI